MSALTEQAKELGATTKFTASEVSNLQLEFAKLGFTQKEIQNVTGATLELAAAAGTELANAAVIAGSTLRGFGLDTSETQRLVDVMAKSFSSSSLDIEKFKVAMAAVAPVANTFGFSLEETTALIGTLTDRGIDASAAGTGLRNMFLDANKAGITFQQALDKINNSTDKAGASFDLFGKRGATLGVILAENQDATAGLTSTLEGTGGAAKEMADKQLDTLQGSLDLLRSAWEGFILGADGAGGASEKLKKIIKGLADNLPQILNSILAITAAFAGFKILKIAIGLFKTFGIVIKAARFSMIALNIVMTANPIGLLIVAIGGAVTLFIVFRKEIIALTTSFDGWMKIIMAMIFPLGLLLELLPGVAEETKKLTAEQKRNNKVNKEALEQGKEILKQSQREISSAQILLTALTDENTTREEKNKIIKTLNERYPELLENIDLEKASSEELLAVKKKLTEQILQQAIEEKKAAITKQFTNAIIEKEIELLLAPTDAARKQKQKELDELTASIPLIAEVAARVEQEISGIVDKMTDTGEEYEEVSDQITKVSNQLNAAIAAGDEERIASLEKKLSDLEAKRKRLLGFGIEGVTTDPEAGTGAAKTAEDKRNKAIQDLRKKHQLELIKIENEGIAAGLDKELIETQIFERRRLQLIEELALTKKLFKEGSEEALEAAIRLQNEFLKLAQKHNIERLEIQKKGNDEIIKEDKTLADLQLESFIKVSQELAKERKKREEERKKAMKELQKNLADTLKIVEAFTENSIKNTDLRIASNKSEIAESKNVVNDLKERAAQGNITAQESIKAEKIKQDSLQANIQDLERKRARLLLITTTLQQAQLFLQQGNVNAFADAGKNVQTLLAGLPTFKKGTESTGKGGNLDRDGGFLAINHPDERIIPSDLNRFLLARGMSNEDVVASAIAHQDGIMTQKASGSGSFENIRMLAALNGLKSEMADSKKSIVEAVNNKPVYMGAEWDDIRKGFIHTIKTNNELKRIFERIG